jgi:hypothetical protein
LPAAPIARFSVLVLHHQNADLIVMMAVNDGVRKSPQGEYSSLLWDGRPKSRIFNQKPGDAFKLAEKTPCDQGPSVFVVKRRSVGDILLGLRVD